MGSVAAEIGAEARSGSEVPSREGLAGSVLAQEAGKGVYAAPIAEPVDYVAAMAEAFKLSPRETGGAALSGPRPIGALHARGHDPFQEHHRDAH